MKTIEQVIDGGGEYLLIMRSFIKNEFANGSTVRWGSNESLQGVITVKQLENLAYSIAQAAIRQDRSQREHEEKMDLMRRQ